MSSSAGPTTAAAASNCERSTNWPRPVCLRFHSATSAASAPVYPPAHVGVGISVARRLAVGLGHHQRVSGERLERGTVTYVARARAGMPEARHADADDAGIDFRKARVIHPPSAHHASREIIDHEIGFRGELAREFDPARIAHVDRGGEFAAMQVALEAELAITERRRILALDLDDLRAVIGENPRRHGTGDDPGEIEHANSFERQPRHRQITPSAASAASSAGSRPSSPRRISPVCSPTSGGRRSTRHGVPFITYGAPG